MSIIQRRDHKSFSSHPVHNFILDDHQKKWNLAIGLGISSSFNPYYAEKSFFPMDPRFTHNVKGYQYKEDAFISYESDRHRDMEANT